MTVAYVAPEDSAFGVSLFERLEIGAPARHITQGPPPEQVLESIKRNVVKVLNTRIGESMSAPTLGLVDLNDAMLGSHDIAMRVKRAIRQCLDVYEPRLEQVMLSVIPDEDSPMNIRFHIRAKINQHAVHDSVEIDLLLDNQRKYKVV